jgi:signal transduction histidine kinase/DNA-binding LacI/PurR family transcriptional regulator
MGKMNAIPNALQADPQRPKRGLNRFSTIGYLVTDLIEAYNIEIHTELSAAVRKQGNNLISFLGGHFRNSPYDPFNYQRNAAYDLAATSVDGLIINSILGNYISKEELGDFYARYSLLPLVSIGKGAPNIASVLVDATKGMKEALVHLIDNHGYRQIAFIRGPECHFEAEVRYQTYTDVLVEYGLPLDPRLVAPGNFRHSAGVEAVRLLLDERKVSMQAIVAANDEMALGALEALTERGVHVPDAMAVVGFDDIENAKAITPSLTTVCQPLSEQAKKAVEILFSLWTDERPQAQVILPTKLAVRRSCGCLDSEVVQAAPGVVASTEERADTETLAECIWAAMKESLKTYGLNPDLEWGKTICEAFAAALNHHTPGVFLQCLDKMLRTTAGERISVCHGLISALRRHSLPYLSGERLHCAEDLWQQARVTIALATQQRQAHLRIQTMRQSDALQKIEEVLAVTFDTEMLMNVLAEGLPHLGIKSCYLSLYEDSNSSGESAPEWCRLMLAYNQTGRIGLEPGGRRFLSCDLVPEGLLPQDRLFDFVLQPLYFQKNPLGFILFEKGPQDGRIYEMLRAQLSSALQSALLVQQVKRHSSELETAYNTLQKQQAQLQQSQKMEAIGTLAGGIAHDFNNLLSVIKGYTELLLEDCEQSDPRRADLERIANAGERAATLTSQLLAFSRKQILQPHNLDLNEVLIEISAMLSRLIGEHIEVTNITGSDLGRIYADPAQIQQVLMNLVVNARDAMPHGGKLAIETANADLDEEYVRSHPAAKQGAYVMMAISDTGTGMDEATQSRIFEPFFTTKPKDKGTGLGLSIVYGIVKQSNGFIRVNSELGKGTVFKIYFPRVRGEIQGIKSDGSLEHDVSGSETVLIAEDEEAVRALACRILKEHGYKVLDAPSGMEALRLARDFAGMIDLVITDVVMPGMSGRILVSKMEAAHPNIKSLYISGYTDNAFAHQGILDPEVHFLQKPFTVKSLTRKVRAVLDCYQFP